MKKRQMLDGCFKIKLMFSRRFSKTPANEEQTIKMRGSSANNFNINVCVARCLTVKIYLELSNTVGSTV